MKFTLEVMLFEKHKNHKNKKHTRPHPPKADKCEIMDKPKDNCQFEKDHAVVQQLEDELCAPPVNHVKGDDTMALMKELPEEEAMKLHAVYLPIVKLGRFAGVAVGTTVTVYTDNHATPAITGIFQGIIKDAKEAIALILASGILYRIPVKEAKFVSVGA
ncbi:hypothetical protein [Niallia sp. MER 6]|uniref:hypothetical protein n=1 Tax=Niallia sp. MER 6 TaxID=2939567 RepID=UPI00203AF61B|nr:hypothetical protein [Niallia sp. MER 6]MCM3033183.1 hypothetical protein [Niallia sp. MER 6]